MQFDPSHNSAIINYYHTTYSTSCSNEPNYFATWQFLAAFTHSIMILQLPLIIFTGYCILQKTPKEMGSLKWAMLNVHFWTTYMDVILCSLITPYIFFPALGGFSVGLLQVIGVPIKTQTFIGISSVGFMFSSIAALFENRSSSFKRNRFRINRSSTRFLFFLSTALIFNLLLIPVFLHLPDQNMGKLYWLENVLKCPTIEFFTSPVFIFILEKFWGYYTAVVLTFEFSSTIFTAIFFISCTWYYMFYSDTHIHSPITKRLQRMFFIGNLIQIAVPSAFWQNLEHESERFMRIYILEKTCRITLNRIVVVDVPHLDGLQFNEYWPLVFGKIAISKRFECIDFLLEVQTKNAEMMEWMDNFLDNLKLAPIGNPQSKDAQNPVYYIATTAIKDGTYYSQLITCHTRFVTENPEHCRIFMQ